MTNTIDYHPSMAGHIEKVLSGEYALPESVSLPEKPLILDIGANCGAFTKWAKDNYSDAKIIAYEPNPEALRYYAKNHPGQKVMPAAITGSDQSMVTLYLGKHNIGEASTVIGIEQCGESIEVPAINANTLPSCDFAKIDCEGMELVIVEELAGRCKAIAAEVHSCADMNQIAIILSNHGYRWFADVTGTERWIVKAWLPELESTPESKHEFDNVFIGIPIHYTPTANFMLSCMALQGIMQGARWKFLVGDSHPDRARNIIVSEFMRSDKDYLLFLDADLKFNRADIAKLIRHNVDIAVGFYAKKMPGMAQWVGTAIDPTPDENGIVTMREAGTGCMLIHRRVFESIHKAYPDRHYIADGSSLPEYDYFSSGVRYCPDRKANRWMSEDWAFCMDARQCGYTIHGDTNIVLLHEGACLFPTDYERKEST